MAVVARNPSLALVSTGGTLADAGWERHRVVAIVVNYRTPALTMACVESLLASDVVEPCVIVIDNDSRDDSVSQLSAFAAARPRVHLVSRPVNDGYTGGNNAGVAIARAMGARHVFILNSDTIVDRSALLHLTGALDDDPAIALAVPSILDGRAPGRLWFGGARFSQWNGRPVHVGLGRDASHGWSEARDLPFATGCAMLVAIDRLDGEPFDATLFAYAEDLDLSLRLRARGARLRYVPAATVEHFEGGSHRNRGGGATRFYFTTRNLLRVTARHAHWYHWPVLAPSLAVNVVGRFSAVAVRDGDWGALAAIWRGAWHALSGGRHPVERQRHESGASVPNAPPVVGTARRTPR